MRISRKAINSMSVERLSDVTKTGDTVKLVYQPLEGGTPRWELRNKDNEVLFGSFDKEFLIETAKMANLKVVEKDE